MVQSFLVEIVITKKKLKAVLKVEVYGKAYVWMYVAKSCNNIE